MRAPISLTLIFASLALLSPPASGQRGLHTFDTVQFSLKNKLEKDPDEPVPHIWIDTKIKVDGLLGGGKVKSNKPYHIRFDFTDNQDALAAFEVTRIKITYADGKIEESLRDIKLPHRLKARVIETVNSAQGGRIVRDKVNHISGTLGNVITRDEGFKLELEGFFQGRNGKRIPVTIDYDYAVRLEKGRKPLIDG